VVTQGRPWWHPERHADRRPALLARNRIRDRLRGWFAEQGFVEVDVPALQRTPGLETHLHAFHTERYAPDGTLVGRPYLHTSPELACKKLLAAGETRLVTFAHAYRNREAGPLHAAEFLLLEWYRADAPYTTLMEDCAVLLQLAAEAAGTGRLSHRGVAIDPTLPPERLTLAEAFARYAGIDLLATIDDAGQGDREALAAALRGRGMRVAPDDSWSDLFSRTLVGWIEPHLGCGRATILHEYPAPEAALARRKADDPRVALRFELYACGVELANGFDELADPAEQRRRAESAMAEKQRLYGERFPIDEEFLAALALMPQASGVALGLDRLAMLAVGADRLDAVQWMPDEPDRA
jgi:lysyl-tRNA synthetase class 2